MEKKMQKNEDDFDTREKEAGSGNKIKWTINQFQSTKKVLKYLNYC